VKSPWVNDFSFKYISKPPGRHRGLNHDPLIKSRNESYFSSRKQQKESYPMGQLTYTNQTKQPIFYLLPNVFPFKHTTASNTKKIIQLASHQHTPKTSRRMNQKRRKRFLLKSTKDLIINMINSYNKKPKIYNSCTDLQLTLTKLYTKL